MTKKTKNKTKQKTEGGAAQTEDETLQPAEGTQGLSQPLEVEKPVTGTPTTSSSSTSVSAAVTSKSGVTLSNPELCIAPEAAKPAVEPYETMSGPKQSAQQDLKQLQHVNEEGLTSDRHKSGRDQDSTHPPAQPPAVSLQATPTPSSENITATPFNTGNFPTTINLSNATEIPLESATTTPKSSSLEKSVSEITESKVSSSGTLQMSASKEHPKKESSAKVVGGLEQKPSLEKLEMPATTSTTSELKKGVLFSQAVSGGAKSSSGGSNMFSAGTTQNKKQEASQVVGVEEKSISSTSADSSAPFEALHKQEASNQALDLAFKSSVPQPAVPSVLSTNSNKNESQQTSDETVKLSSNKITENSNFNVKLDEQLAPTCPSAAEQNIKKNECTKPVAAEIIKEQNKLTANVTAPEKQIGEMQPTLATEDDKATKSQSSEKFVTQKTSKSNPKSKKQNPLSDVPSEKAKLSSSDKSKRSTESVATKPKMATNSSAQNQKSSAQGKSEIHDDLRSVEAIEKQVPPRELTDKEVQLLLPENLETDNSINTMSKEQVRSGKQNTDSPKPIGLGPQINTTPEEKPKTQTSDDALKKRNEKSETSKAQNVEETSRKQASTVETPTSTSKSAKTKTPKPSKNLNLTNAASSGSELSKPTAAETPVLDKSPVLSESNPKEPSKSDSPNIYKAGKSSKKQEKSLENTGTAQSVVEQKDKPDSAKLAKSPVKNKKQDEATDTKAKTATSAEAKKNNTGVVESKVQPSTDTPAAKPNKKKSKQKGTIISAEHDKLSEKAEGTVDGEKQQAEPSAKAKSEMPVSTQPKKQKSKTKEDSSKAADIPNVQELMLNETTENQNLNTEQQGKSKRKKKNRRKGDIDTTNDKTVADNNEPDDQKRTELDTNSASKDSQSKKNVAQNSITTPQALSNSKKQKDNTPKSSNETAKTELNTVAEDTKSVDKNSEMNQNKPAAKKRNKRKKKGLQADENAGTLQDTSNVSSHGGTNTKVTGDNIEMNAKNASRCVSSSGVKNCAAEKIGESKQQVTDENTTQKGVSETKTKTKGKNAEQTPVIEEISGEINSSEQQTKSKRNKKKKTNTAGIQNCVVNDVRTPPVAVNVPQSSTHEDKDRKEVSETENSTADTTKGATKKAVAPKLSPEAREEKNLKKKLAERAQQKLQTQLESNCLSETEKSEKYLETITKNLKELTKLQTSKLDDIVQKTSDQVDNSEEFEYELKAVQRKTFLANCCHVCKATNSAKGLRKCNQCQMISYCSENHQKSDWPDHKDFCQAVFEICKQKGLRNLFQKASGLSPEDFRSYRMNCILECTNKLNRQLEPYEQEMILYPHICHTCYISDWDKLQTCEKCRSVSYCSPEHRQATHDKWCSDVQLYESLVRFQIKNGVLSPKLPSRIAKTYEPLQSDMKDLLERIIGNPAQNPFEYVTLTEVATAPLTALLALQKANKLSAATEKLVIHFVGAEWSFELEKSSKWEVFILHLLPSLKSLMLVFVGPEMSRLPKEAYYLLKKDSKICTQCEEKGCKVDIQIPSEHFYHEYVAGSNYQKPDIICAFNAGLYRTSGHDGFDSWAATIEAMLKDPQIPVVVTSYTSEEIVKDVDRMKQHKSSNVLLPPVENPYRSSRPNRNFASDEITPVIFKNYYVAILASITS